MNIPRGTTYSKLMNSFLVSPYGVSATKPQSHVYCSLIMTDSRLDDELSVAIIEFTDTPQWLRNLAQDPGSFPMKTTLGTLWNQTAIDTTAQDSVGQTEFIRAVITYTDRAGLFYPEMLAECGDVDVNTRDNTGRTALHWASALGLSDMVQLCLSVPDCDVAVLDNTGYTAFDLALGAGNGSDAIPTLFYRSIFEMEQTDPQGALLRTLTMSSEPDEDKPIFPGEALFDSIKDRNSHLVAALIKRRVDLTVRDRNGNMTLHLAVALADNREITVMLLKAGADIHALGNTMAMVLQAIFGIMTDMSTIGAAGATPSDLAADDMMVQTLSNWKSDMVVIDRMPELQCAEQIKQAVQHSAEFLVPSLEKQTATPEPPPQGLADIEMQILRDRFADLKRLAISIGGQNEWDRNIGHLALVKALSSGDCHTAQVLLELGIDKNTLVSPGVTALQRAAADGHCAMVRTLLAAGAYTEVWGMNGTVLHEASRGGHDEVVKTLLAAGANMEAKYRDETALHMASQLGHDEVVMALLAAGADMEAKNQSVTALHMASQRGHNTVVNTLLAAGADIQVSGNAATALHLASWDGHDEVVKTLLAAGADIAANDPGETALHMASKRGHNAVVNTLLAAGADTELPGDGGTALHEASSNGRNAVVLTLLAAGAKIEASHRGNTPCN
ncbi:hypothetical protein Q9L58_001470 [Maublancomyces gigas]|uniref:Uncharacterized protein n=1 Tax=Discina gigas TaxID=1032678 RepID=A0ABR3GU46_9PEZI